MRITRSIGKNTLGSGNKMKVDLRTFNRSTHDMSYLWRNTQAPATLVPFMCELSTANETWEIDLNHSILTHPTVGPLFGRFKFQADVFTCPIRLYNAMLHNNALNVGMNMKKVKLPKLMPKIYNPDGAYYSNIREQINQSCLLRYLGLSGYGYNSSSNEVYQDKKNATALIAYYDIFKNYYANKQEEDFYIISENESFKCYTSLQLNSYDPIPGNEWKDECYIGIPDKNFNPTASEEIRVVMTNKNPNIPYVWYDQNDIMDGEMSSQTWNIDGVNTPMQVFKTKKNPNENQPQDVIVISVAIVKDLGLKKYRLEDIDEVREQILAKGQAEYQIVENDDVASKPYLYNFVSRNNANGSKDQTYQDAVNLPYGGHQYYCKLNSTSTQYGLCLKTYQSDIFNNWINTEWIDGDNGINKITAVKIDPETNSFQLDTLNLAKKVYDMLNRIAVSGGTYQDWLETVYTGQYINRSETPVYEGGMSAMVEFQEVVSNSATENEPLGTLAGRGKTTGQKGGHLVIKVDEPSYIIGICSLTPIVDYCQGNRFDVNLDTLDDLHKPALDAIGFQDRMAETIDWNSVEFFKGTKHNFSIGKQPAWIDYMTNYNKTFGNFAIKDNEAFMVLNRYYTTAVGAQEGDYSTYIDPAKYNYIFADVDLKAMNFWVQIGCDIKRREPISAKVIPNV